MQTKLIPKELACVKSTNTREKYVTNGVFCLDTAQSITEGQAGGLTKQHVFNM